MSREQNSPVGRTSSRLQSEKSLAKDQGGSSYIAEDGFHPLLPGSWAHSFWVTLPRTDAKQTRQRSPRGFLVYSQLPCYFMLLQDKCDPRT